MRAQDEGCCNDEHVAGYYDSGDPMKCRTNNNSFQKGHPT